ncbi:hypothetical protein SERLADRAFT_414536 [Serpula lacrymans var. lacrymans S7.9]|uniref:Uncharacterized protein n=1 Tax=Serpula lacrymans var. lacrymans (strain S7.9) TaxID=578457 RepID=F8NQ52_SERL9|nr:uncharacterized protein SERLADRAFT_414536 [Serpula lacrymans var. lacrymans S7.9]EGO26531.1 hypothetical protein SERLADRAFT_414536 [Serpula lacrymans var. lacrymans S7.9]
MSKKHFWLAIYVDNDNDDIEDDDIRKYPKPNYAIVELLLARDDVDVNWRDEHEQLLSRKDINVNLPGEHGDSPLHCAVRSGHQHVTSLLLSHHAIEPNLKNAKGQTPLHCTVVGTDPEKNPPNYRPMGRQEVIAGLLLAHRNIRVDLEDDNGSTALMLARSLSAVPIVKLLEVYAMKSGAKWMNKAPLMGTMMVGHQTIRRGHTAKPSLCRIPCITTVPSRAHANDRDISHNPSELSSSCIIHDDHPPSPD